MNPRLYKRYVLALLLLVFIVNQLDRAIFGILMQPIKRELALSDTQLGFIAGPALVLFYATLGIPIARWADRGHRINIMSAAILVWSGVVTLTAAVGSFAQLALARVGVGIGEAGFSAIAISVIAEYYPPVERPRAMSIFVLALPVAGLLSYVLGGWLNQAYGWRWAFLIAGPPGVLLALLMKCTLQEPPRARGLTDSGEIRQSSLLSVLGTIWRRKALRHLSLGLALFSVVTATMLAWLPAFFARSYNTPSGKLGTSLAITMGVGGIGGVWLSGQLNRFRRPTERTQALILALSAVLAFPTLIAVLLYPSQTVALIVLFPASVLMYFFLAPAEALLQDLCESAMRATVSAAVILLQTLLAGVVGLQLVGILSDALRPKFGENGLRWALVFICTMTLWAAAHFWVLARSITQDGVEAFEGHVANPGRL